MIVDERLIRAARRCRESWHSLQELGGIHNSHAERLLAREKKAWEEQAEAAALRRAPRSQAQPARRLRRRRLGCRGARRRAASRAEKRSPDEAYIETARCTTCNECTQINDKMFAYNENKQAYIADSERRHLRAAGRGGGKLPGVDHPSRQAAQPERAGPRRTAQARRAVPLRRPSPRPTGGARSGGSAMRMWRLRKAENPPHLLVAE